MFGLTIAKYLFIKNLFVVDLLEWDIFDKKNKILKLFG